MIGVVLAGGLGSRMGGPKAATPLAGRPLISYPVAALRDACERVAVVCKRDTELPPLADVERWDEPDEPRHPVAGIVHALEHAAAPVLVCAADMPFVTTAACGLVVGALDANAGAAVAHAGGRLHPLLGAYAPTALDGLRSAPPNDPLMRTIEALAPVRVELDAELVFNVNTPDELAEAERRLRSR